MLMTVATGGVKPNGNLIKASVTQISEKLERRPPDGKNGLANHFFVKLTATNIYRHNDITTNTTSRHTPVGTHLDLSREGPSSSTAYRTLEDGQTSMASGLLSLVGRLSSLTGNNPQTVGTFHGRLHAHEFNNLISHSEEQILTSQQRRGLQSAETIHGRLDAHGLSGQPVQSTRSTSITQERVNPNETHTHTEDVNTTAPQENITQEGENINTQNSLLNPNRRMRRANFRKNVKAAIKVASLNMRGFGNDNSNHSQNKWNHVNQIMRDERIGILLLQETHMNMERYNQIKKLFENKLHVLYSADPDAPTRKGGVAIILNKRFIPTQGTDTIRADNIVSGRALLLTLKLKEQRSLKILAIYAPNNPGNNRDFWNTIKDYFEQNPNKKPDIMAGDFNMVEDSLDRLPTHNDQEDTTEALDSLKQALGLEDGWRNTFPHKAAYTYLQSNGTKSQSRIDRIYSKPSITATAREWKITTTGMPHADHKMVSVKVVDEDAPQTGRGRWSLPHHLITDGPLLKYTVSDKTVPMFFYK
jgi:exonuclease III